MVVTLFANNCSRTLARYGASVPHRNLHAALNRFFVQSEVEGGVYLSDLKPGCRLEVETRNHRYLLVHQGWGRALISGHPELCPEPVEVAVAGSSWGGSLLKSDFIGRGLRLEFEHPVHRLVTTSPIQTLREYR